MATRRALLIPFLALLAAGTAACGSASTGTSAGAAPTTGPTSAGSTSRSHARPAPTTTRTVTVMVTRTTTPRPVPSGTATTSAPSFAPFAGEWVGHTRGVSVSAGGRLEEHVGDGCCDPVIDLVLQLSNPHRSGAAWVASSRVVSATMHDGWKAYGQPAPKPGDRGTVTVGSDHILVESISSNGFCDPDRTAPGTCGA